MSDTLFERGGLQIDTYAGPESDRPRQRIQISCYQPDTNKFRCLQLSPEQWATLCLAARKLGPVPTPKGNP